MGTFGMSPKQVNELDDGEYADAFRKAAWYLKITNPFPAKKK